MRGGLSASPASPRRRSDAKAAQIIGQHAKGIMAEEEEEEEEEEKEEWEEEQISILPLCLWLSFLSCEVGTVMFNV